MNTPVDEYAGYETWKAWEAESFGSGHVSLMRTYEAVLTTHVRSQRGIAVDFGFGNGEMLGALRAADFETYGVDRNERLVNIGNSAGFTCFTNLAECIEHIDNRPIEVITAFHVLEHLTKPQLLLLLRSFEEVLSKGGVLIAAFPNGDSPFSAPAFNGDITHQTFIGSSMANQLGHQTGLHLLTYRSFPAVPTFSPKLSSRLLGIVRSKAESLISALLCKVYYGSANYTLAPTALAVWQKPE